MSIRTRTNSPLSRASLPILLTLVLAAGACGDDSAGDAARQECQAECADVGDGAQPDVGEGAQPDTGGCVEDCVDAGELPASAPTVLSSAPLDGAVGVHTTERISVTFSVPMDEATLNTDSIRVTSGDAQAEVAGRVTTHPGAKAVFWPTAPLATGTGFTVEISTEATSASGVSMGAPHRWSFTTGDATLPMRPVDLGSAGDFVILAKAAVSTASASTVTGDIGLSPAAASYITQFSLIADATNVFATSAQVTGKIFAADYQPPTPSMLTTAVGDMEIAFQDAAGRPAGVTELGDGGIGGLTLEPGVYKWGTGVSIATDVTLNGGATDVWIFQIAGDLTMASAKKILLTGGAQAKNVFWQVSGKVEIGTTSHLEGIVLGQTAVTLNTGATVTGRLLAQTAVTLDASTVVEPAE